MHYSFRSFFAAFGLAFVLFILTGCTGSVQKTNSGSGSGSGSQNGGSGALTVSATSLNFQTVTVGQTGTQTLQLTNSGTSAVTVDSVEMAIELANTAAPGSSSDIIVISGSVYLVGEARTLLMGGRRAGI